MHMALMPSETAVPTRERVTGSQWSPFDFVGRMTAIVAILAIAPATARAMLPAGLDLAAQHLTPRQRHPLVLIMGQQSDVRLRLLPLGAEYREAILALPFVELRERGAPRGPFCYCPRLFLDRRLPILAGRLLYAYAKRRAAIRMTAASYSIAERAGADPLLEAHFRITGEAVEAPWGGAAMFDLPVISRAPHAWWYSCADVGLERAVLQRVELRLAIHRPFAPGLPVGEFVIADAAGAASSAFHMRTNWRLAGPWARRSPQPAAAGSRAAQRR
jgi:hypothetical protein